MKDDKFKQLIRNIRLHLKEIQSFRTGEYYNGMKEMGNHIIQQIIETFEILIEPLSGKQQYNTPFGVLTIIDFDSVKVYTSSEMYGSIVFETNQFTNNVVSQKFILIK